MSDRMQNLYEGASLLVKLANKEQFRTQGSPAPQEKTAGLRDAVARGAKRYTELLRGGDSDHLVRNAGRKMSNTIDNAHRKMSRTAERASLRVYRRGDMTKTELEDRLTEYLPKSERDLAQKENLKILGARLGTGAALGAGGYGAHKMLRSGQREKTSGLRDATIRGAVRYTELLRGGDSAHLARNTRRKADDLWARTSNRIHKRGDVSKAEVDDILSRSMPKAERDLAQKENLKILGARLGTMGVLGTGLVGAARKRADGERRLAEDLRNQVPEEGLE